MELSLLLPLDITVPSDALTPSSPWLIAIVTLVTMAVIPLCLKVLIPYIENRRTFNATRETAIRSARHLELDRQKELAQQQANSAAELRRGLERIDDIVKDLQTRDAVLEEREKRAAKIIEDAARILGYADKATQDK